MKSLTTKMSTALVDPVIHMLHLVRIEFDGGTVAWNNGYLPIVYNSITYHATGALATISAIEEQEGVKASGVNITVSAIDPSVVAALLSSKYLGRKVFIYCALTNADFTFDPDMVKLLFAGSIDNITGNIGDQASFVMSVQSRLADWERARVLRYTDADQRKLYPGDKGLEYIPQLSQKRIVWPRAAFLPDMRKS